LAEKIKSFINVFKIQHIIQGDKMKISELKPRQSSVNVEVEVVELGEVREFQKFGRAGRVATANIKDDSGEIKLTLWNEDIDKVKVGTKIKITNGYVNEFQGEMQLTAGRFGKLEIVGEEGEEELKETEKEEKAVAEVGEETKEKEEGPSEEEVSKEEEIEAEKEEEISGEIKEETKEKEEGPSEEEVTKEEKVEAIVEEEVKEEKKRKKKKK